MGVKSVKAVRGFYYDGKLVKAGDVVTVPGIFAIEVIAGNKAIEFIAEAKPNVNVDAEQEVIKAGDVVVEIKPAQRKAGKGDGR